MILFSVYILVFRLRFEFSIADFNSAEIFLLFLVISTVDVPVIDNIPSLNLETLVVSGFLIIGGTVDTLGGTQGSSGTGMGSSTSDNQLSQFDNLVNFDCKRIANALQVAINKCVKSFDKNGEVKCRFEFVEKEKLEMLEEIMDKIEKY